MKRNGIIIIIALVVLIGIYFFSQRKRKGVVQPTLPPPPPPPVQEPQSFTQTRIVLEGKEYSKLHGISEILDSGSDFIKNLSSSFLDIANFFRKSKDPVMQSQQEKWQQMWSSLSEKERNALRNIPGFQFLP